jgi:hypothetical protein
MSTVGTTIILAVHHENMFFTEHVTRHFQRNTDDSVELLLIINDQTSSEVADLVDYLSQSPRTRVHKATGVVDRPIGMSIDHALAAKLPFRERLLFTHMDLIYLEPGFWKCAALSGDVKMVSGRFVQEPLWFDSNPDPIPRPADDHILIDTDFYFSHGLIFRSFGRAAMAFPKAPWLAASLRRFRNGAGRELTDEYALDPFNLSHLKIAHDLGGEAGKVWSFHFPRQCHANSVLRVFRDKVRRRTEKGLRHLYLPRQLSAKGTAYHWKSLIRYSIISSYLFDPRVDYVVPVASLMAERRNDVMRCWREIRSIVKVFRSLIDPMPYRVQGAMPDPSFKLHLTE